MRSQISLRDANPFGLASAAAVERMLADIRGLAPEITAQAAGFEHARRIPPELVETLRSIGVFRIFTPRSHGGLELELPKALEVITALSRIDGSVGWDAMIGSASGLFLPLLPGETYERILRDGPDVICAGSIAPVGTAEPAPGGGWRVSGRWPFASGCQHADWILGFCVMTRDGRPIPGRSGEAGPPLIRGLVLPARDWRIEDTWHVAGLRGTGSHHVSLQDALVPEEQFFDFLDGRPCVPGPLYKAVRQLLPLLHGAFSIGMAEGALAELIALAGTGRQQLRAPAPMRDSEVFQSDLGRIAAEVRAARAYHRAQVESHWRHALAGTLKDDALHAEGTQAGIWIASTCVHAADACFTLAGGAALYDSSPLQRRLRDQHAAAQHAAVHQRFYVDAGRALLERARAA